MFTNLTLINPSKENELFSIHKTQKKFFSQHSSHTIYKPYKTCFTSLKKEKNNVVSMTDINRRNKTNYNLKSNVLTHVPYPSFSNNNKIPSIYQNFKTIKNQKTNDRKFTLFNYNKFLNQNNKIICLKHNPNLRLKTEYTKNKTITLSNKNTIYNGKSGLYSQLNNFSSYPNIFRNKNNGKIIENKKNIKTNYFNDILDNMMHLIEVRDDHNNNIFYTKVANLLIEEMKKFENGRINKLKRKTTKNLSIMKLGKEGLCNRKQLLSGYSDSSNINRRLKRLNSLKSSNNFNMNFFKKYGFKFENQISNKIRNFYSQRKSISFLPSFEPMQTTKNTYKINDKEYKDEYNQTFESSIINNTNTINNDNDNNNNTNKHNYFVGKVKHETLKRNKQYLNTINNSKKINETSNNNNFQNNEELLMINFNKSNTTNNIFNSFIKDNIKRKEIEKEQKQKQNNKTTKHKEKGKEKEEIFSFAHLLDSIAKQINNNPNKEDKKDIADKSDKNDKTEKEYNSIFQNKQINMSNLTIFEQMVYNPRLIQLIHEYEEEKENQNKSSKNEIIEEKKEKEKGKINLKNINFKENNKNKDIKEKLGIKDNQNKVIKNYTNITEKEKKMEMYWKDKNEYSEGENDINERKEETENIEKIYLENDLQKKSKDKEISIGKEGKKIKSILIKEKKKNKKEDKKEINTNIFIIKEIELGLEIIKHICNEIDIDGNEEAELLNVINNLKEITIKENASKKEIIYQKKMMRILNEIINEYIKNMNRINASKRKPKNLFSKTFKLYLKKKLKEIINISPDDYYYEEEEEEDNNDNEKVVIPKKRIKLEEKNPKKSKSQSKKLVYDNSYFFNKSKHKDHLDNLKLKINSVLNDENDYSKEKESLANKNTILGASTSTDFEFNERSKKTRATGKSSKFTRIKKSIGLKKIMDEKAENIKKNIFKIDENYTLSNNEILEKKLKQFFEQIKQLKNVKSSKDEERLRIFIDKEMEKFDYTQQKKMEERRFNFFNDLKIQIMASKNGNLLRSKYQYQSPIIFNTFKNKE